MIQSLWNHDGIDHLFVTYDQNVQQLEILLRRQRIVLLLLLLYVLLSQRGQTQKITNICFIIAISPPRDQGY